MHGVDPSDRRGPEWNDREHRSSDSRLRQQEKKEGRRPAPPPAEAEGEAVEMVERVVGAATDADGDVHMTDYTTDYFV